MVLLCSDSSFLKSLGALQYKKVNNDDFAFPLSPAFWPHAEQKENTSNMFILSKAIDKPTQQDTTFFDTRPLSGSL